MPRPSKIDLLPAAVRRELDLRVIVQSRFTGYKSVHEPWLNAQGYEISHAAIQRHYRPIRDALRAEHAAWFATNEIVKLAAAEARADGEDVALASERLLQVATFDRIRELRESSEITLETLQEFEVLTRGQRLTRMRAATERKRDAEASTLAQAAAAGVEAVRKPDPEGRRQGLSSEVLAAIDRRLMPE